MAALDGVLKQFETEAVRLQETAPRLALAVLLALLLWVLWRGVRRAVRALAARSTDDLTTIAIAVRSVRFFFASVAVLLVASVAFPGLSLSSVVTALGLGSIAIGFAFKDVLENALAGYSLLLSRTFRIGDVIEVQGRRGTVRKIETRTTQIELFNKEVLVVPNGLLFREPVIVVTRNAVRRFETAFALANGSDVERPRDAALASLAEFEGVEQEPVPSAAVEQTGGQATVLRVYWWANVPETDLFLLQARVAERLRSALAEAGADFFTGAR